ncbi:hypothetical protein MMC07_010009 [Pseudocyphellaria aurata]|nr:hypothetical protein [Pseudocyphellaria aurata]
MPSLSLTVLFTTVLFGLATAADNATAVGDIPASVDGTQKAQWCSGQRNSCPYLCGGPSFLKDNVCLGSDITNYICACNNGSSPPPDIAQYLNTVPNFACNARFAQCRKDTPGSQSCKTCGTLDPMKIPAAVSSTSSASSTQASSTSAAPAATTSASAQGNNAARWQMDAGAVLGALAAAGALM